MKGPGAILLIAVGIFLLWLAFSGTFTAVWDAVVGVIGIGTPSIPPAQPPGECTRAPIDPNEKCGTGYTERTIEGERHCCKDDTTDDPPKRNEGPGMSPAARKKMGCVELPPPNAGGSCGRGMMEVHDAQGDWCCPASGGGHGTYGIDASPAGGFLTRYLPNER